MKFNISKEWCEKAGESEAFSNWFERLVALANERGVAYLIGEDISHRDSFRDGNTPEQELGSLVEEARHNNRPSNEAMPKQLPAQYWAYITATGALVPSTIREKEGDAKAALQKTDAKYRVNDTQSYRLVRVSVELLPA